MAWNSRGKISEKGFANTNNPDAPHKDNIPAGVDNSQNWQTAEAAELNKASGMTAMADVYKNG